MEINPNNSAILEIDVHGMTKYQAKVYIDSLLKKIKQNTYRIRVIHGYQNGTELRDMIRKDYRNNPKVCRIEVGMNQGITDLVLREL